MVCIAQLTGHGVDRLGALPVLCEAMVDSAVFIGVYGMPPALGFTGGFILSALSPTVLVTGARAQGRLLSPANKGLQLLQQVSGLRCARHHGAAVPRAASLGGLL